MEISGGGVIDVADSNSKQFNRSILLHAHGIGIGIGIGIEEDSY